MNAQGPASVVVYVNGKSHVESASSPRGLSAGEHSGKLSGRTRDILRQFRDETPARWMAFLHSHFSGPAEVSAFFDTDEKTGRNWWHGVGRPTLDKALYAQQSYPDSYSHYMLAAE